MRRLLVALLGSALAGCAIAAPLPADLIITGARIHTVDAAQPEATALAVQGGRIVYVGDDKGALNWRGPATRVEAMDGRRVLPGLVDAHIHPLGIVATGGCDLDNAPLTLAQISVKVADCVKAQKLAPGAWLPVAQWNPFNGNQADAAHPSFRAALDKAAPDNPVQLLGNDGHHGAFNSAALKLAKAPDGRVVGFSKASLAGPFKAWELLVAVGPDGEPTGGINEDARALMGPQGLGILDLGGVMKAPERVMARLAESGITAFLDAATNAEDVIFYDTLLARGAFTARATLAQFYDPSTVRTPDGKVDYDRMVRAATAMRSHFAGNPLVRADAIKLFADGVQEGDPQTGTPPNSPSLKPYHRPLFGPGPDGALTLTGYADGPGSSGKLQHEQAVIMEYVRRMHVAGFQMHIHAIGDRAVRVAVDALAAAGPGGAGRPDTLAHVQVAAPEDVARIGKLGLFLALTYAWVYTDPQYDLSVIPFIDRVRDGSFAALHDPANYYERQGFPVRQLMRAGGVLVAGSDAPVETRDPRPFVNMQSAVTRARGGTPPLGITEAIDIRAVVRAYTLDGARSIGRDSEIGSISVGKSADFIMLDRDILTVPATEIGATRVLGTWFMGKRVWSGKSAAPAAAGE
ncbi:MAG: amidohydrolase [Polymorphobacter sp.]